VRLVQSLNQVTSLSINSSKSYTDAIDTTRHHEYSIADHLNDLDIESNEDCPACKPADQKAGVDDKSTDSTNYGYYLSIRASKKIGKELTAALGSPSWIATLLAPTSAFCFRHEIWSPPKVQHFSRNFVVYAMRGSVEAGTAGARYIDRSLVTKRNFYSSIACLNSCNSDGLTFALQLFCPKGTLYHKHKRVGPWGHELETGGILILQYLCVEKEYRRKGLASAMLREIIAKARQRIKKTKKANVKFMVVFPAVIKEDFKSELKGKTEEETAETEKEAYDMAVKFYRSQGFRRIGLSKWFGLALDPEHKSHQIPMEDDLDPSCH